MSECPAILFRFKILLIMEVSLIVKSANLILTISQIANNSLQLYI